jgi:hypothetical protein
VTVEAARIGTAGTNTVLSTNDAGSTEKFNIDSNTVPDQVHASADLLTRDVLLSGATLMLTPADHRAATDIRFDGPA